MDNNLTNTNVFIKNTNEIKTISEILELPDNSIKDRELIFAIAEWGIKNNNSLLYCKIYKK